MPLTPKTVVAKITEEKGGIVKCREGETFIQCVQVAPEPLCVLALEQQLLDLHRTLLYL